MKPYPLIVKQIATAIAVIAFSQISPAQQTQGRVFGDGTPFGLSDLPPSRAREKLETLPAPAQLHALARLNKFSFHEDDLEFLDFDSEGGVLYADTLLPENITEAGEETGNAVSTPLLETAANVFALHSKPGSSNVLFVDFDGHTISGTAWNSGSLEAVYYAAPFNTEAGDGTLTDAERAQIQEIWHRMAEDFAPFDIDVTTEQPATFTRTTGHVLITRNTDTTGKAMPYGNAGGVAYVGVWGSSSFAYYSPALVYYDNLASHAPYISEAASHEAGHNLNLSHDGSASGSYYSGHGSGYVSWAPIMGVGYYNNVTQWSKGEYSGATQTQDDISIIKGYLGQRSDDHGSSISAATELVISGGTIVTVTNPETDPDNLYSQNKGIIETRADVDTFTFVSGGGTIDIGATPAWDAYYRSLRRGANLDIELTLLDDTGVVATSDPLDDTDAQIVVDAPPGRYYLEVNGVGNSTSPYSDYGSLGQYFIAGSIPAAGGDTTAPNPDPMTWSVTPQAINRGAIQMTATTATDDSGVVEYQFVCIVGGPGCTVSGWQSSPAYTAGGLNANAAYSFQVIARDLYNNVTTASATAVATTPANATPVAGNDAASTNEDNPVTINVLANDSDSDGDSLTIFAIGSATNGSTSTDGTAITYTPSADFSGNDSFSYSVNDGFGGTASAQVTITINPVNDAPTAINDSASVGTNETLVINVLANDSDLDGNPLTLISVSSGNKGSATITGGSVSYTAGSKRGNDTLSYVVSDGTTTATASISISIGRSTSDGGSGGSGGSGKCHPVKGC